MVVIQHPAARSERRQSPRRQPTIGTVCRLNAASDGHSGTGLVWNISTHGISMLLHQGPAAGATLSGELQSGDGQTTLNIGFRVTHVVQLRTGDYVLGGPFLQPLTPEEMQPFLG
jgi:hypothetical protein